VEVEVMKKRTVAVLLALLAAPAGMAANSPAVAQARQARVFNTAAGEPLTSPSTAAPAAIVAGFLSSRGRDQRTLRSLIGTAPGARPGAERIHVRFEQEVEGVRIVGAYAKATLDERGQLVHLIDALVAVPGGKLAPATVTEADALTAALHELYPGLAAGVSPASRAGNTTEFDVGPFFHHNPEVTRVATRHPDGSLAAGFLVETWSDRDNLLHHTVVGGDGRVLSVELRTNTDSYNVFTEDPGKAPQQVVAGPGAGNLESPTGWLFTGTQSSVQINGNNASAYLDTDANNAADAGGSAVTDGNFLTAANLTQQPSTAGNKNVAVQNLFYLNNVIHDILYRHGFDEAAGNFQQDNFGNGGLGGDPVNAEAQDGSGTDNANFSTPSDGSRPRMQMYLWTPTGSHELFINAPASLAGSHAAGNAAFGPTLNGVGVTGNVVLAIDGRGTTTDGCERITNGAAVGGKIALVDRGTCDFSKKVLNAQTAGAIAVIVVNNQGDDVFTMGGANSKITIPSELIGQSDGAAIKAALGDGVNATLRAVAPAPPFRDSGLDADIVFHEYGHGLTWRMIGGMSGAMSGAIGEGMSDVLAILLNGDDRVGEYAYSNPGGIRRYPYAGYPLTYGDFTGAEVHNDGEIYAAIGWRLRELYLADGRTVDTLLSDLVGGMNYTPSGPAFEDMRDGVLQEVAGSGRECLVWRAFAQYGVGVGADAATVRGKLKVTESFALPAACTP
jgi:extracellular elastinolytic metalloproteinase